MSDSSGSSFGGSDDDSNSSGGGGGDEAKMQAMLQGWEDDDDDKGEEIAADVYEDSDTDRSADPDERTRKLALLKASNRSNTVETVDDDDDDDDDENGEGEEEEDEGDEEEEDEDEEDSEEYEEEEVLDDDADDEVHDAVQAATDEEDAVAMDDASDDGNIEDTLKKKPKKRKEKKKLAPLTAATAGDTDEDAAMKALLGEWDGDKKDDDDSDDDDDDDDDEDSDVSEREVQLDEGVIDHIVLAAPHLEDALEEFEKMTGIGAKIFGSINGLGIRCARISFNDSTYLEIIAPDAKQPGPIGQLIKNKGIKELTPFAFAIRSSRAEELKDEVKQFGYVPDHITMFGGKKDGTPRKWEMLYLYGHKLGGICPYFINWANSDHPCATLPVVGKLKKFTVRAPADDPLHQLLEHVGVREMNVETGTAKLSFQFSSPEGTIKFATSKAAGFKFPGFDDDEHDLDTGADDDDEVIFDEPERPELLAIRDDVDEYDDLPPPSY